MHFILMNLMIWCKFVCWFCWFSLICWLRLPSVMMRVLWVRSGYVSRQVREFLLAGNGGPSLWNVQKLAGNSVYGILFFQEEANMATVQNEQYLLDLNTLSWINITNTGYVMYLDNVTRPVYETAGLFLSELVRHLVQGCQLNWILW